MVSKKALLGVSLSLVLTGCQDSAPESREVNAQKGMPDKASEVRVVTPRLVAIHYADLAHAIYSDALITAKKMQEQVTRLISDPTDEHLAQARLAWLKARVPYQQSEVFRFGNGIVDDWEGQVNAWPLDEGFIDYVATDSYDYVMGNPGAQANIIASLSINAGNQVIDVSEISSELISELNEFGGSESNVASGYHAIEFLLWGQDLNGTGPGAGERPATDFSLSNCTNGNCERRGQYLLAATELLLADLAYMVKQWSADGAYRATLNAESESQVLKRILYGMGSLSLGELAGERMKVALLANSSEEEHDCFSDNTHFSHYYNALGIQNIYLGRYTRIDGSVLQGPSLSELTKEKSAEVDVKLSEALTQTMTSMQALVDRAEADQPMKFDMMIAEGNTEGAKLVRDAIRYLTDQTKHIEQVAIVLGLGDLKPESI